MNSKYENQIDKLRSRIIKMGSIVDEQVELAFRALNEWDVSLALHVMARDAKVDALDQKIERQCLRIFALQAPVASDLRLIMAALNINSELERIGDLARNVARAVEQIRPASEIVEHLDLQQMTGGVQRMVRHTIDSFIDNDLALAISVIKSDRNIDQYEERIRKQTIRKMTEDCDAIGPLAHLIIQLRNMERIADHATNIAEEVIFVAKARIIPNRFVQGTVDEIEQEIKGEESS